MASKIGIEIVVDEKGAVTSLKQIGKEGETAGKKIENSFNGSTESLGKFNVKSLAVVASLTAIGYAVFKAGKEFIGLGFETAKSAQKVQTQFKTILGSAELAKERYAELAKFAATTPFELNGVAEASKILETLTSGALSTGDGLRLVGDAAAIAGVKMEELSVTIGRAYSGLQANRPIGEASARLQELGLISGETRNKIEELQTASRGTEAWQILRKELEKTSGGMEELAKTMDGKTSTIIDNLGLASASFLEASGIQGAWNKVLDESISLLDSVISRQGSFDAVNKKGNLTLDEANKKLAVKKQFLSELPLVASAGIVKTKEEIKALEDLIVQLSAEKKQRDEVVIAKKQSQEQEKLEIENKKALAEQSKKDQEELAKIKEQKLKDTESERKIREEQIEFERENFMEMMDNEAKAGAIKASNRQIEYEATQKQMKLDKEKEYQKRMDIANTASMSIGLLREIFGESKAFAIADIIVNTARGVMRSFATLDVPFNAIQAGIIGATGAVQIAKVSGAKFADGTEFVQGRGTNRSDSIPAMLSVGERVIDSNTNAKLGSVSNQEILNAVNGGGRGVNITINAGAGTDGKSLAQVIVNELKRAKMLGLEPSVI